MTSPPSSEEPESIIRHDRANHPDCRYSSSISKACTSVDGNRTCETIRRIIRSCPGSRPEQIFEDSLKDEGNSTRSGAADASPLIPGKIFESDPFSGRIGGGGLFGGAEAHPFSQAPEGDGDPFEDIAGQFFAEIIRPFKGFFDEAAIQFPSMPAAPEIGGGGGSRGSIRPQPPQEPSPWKVRSEPLTPEYPAPHKDRNQRGDRHPTGSQWRGGSTAEQA